MAEVAKDDGQPAGMLKISMGQAFGRAYVVPLLGEFLVRYPAVIPDWHFDNRQVDLIGEGFDAAIGGGFDLAQGVVARELARIHIVATAAPGYMAGRSMPRRPDDLTRFDGIVRRSSPTGRVRVWSLRNAQGDRAAVQCKARLIFDDPEAMCQAAVMGLGVALLPMPFAAPRLRSGELVRWCGCCLAGMTTLGRCRFITRARSCFPPRLALSSSSWSNGFEARALQSLSMAADQAIRRMSSRAPA